MPAAKVTEDGNSIITFRLSDGSELASGQTYYIATLPCDLYGGYRLSIFRDGLVAHYFGVHQRVTSGEFISTTELAAG